MNDVIDYCGRLFGTVRKWFEESEHRDIHQRQIQQNVSELLRVVELVGPCNLNDLMEHNMTQKDKRLVDGTPTGDGRVEEGREQDMMEAVGIGEGSARRQDK